MSTLTQAATTRATPLALAFHLQPGDGAAARTVLIDCDSNTCWAQVRPLLPHPWQTTPAYAHDVKLADHLQVGEPPLLHGATLTDRPAAPAPAALLELAVAEGPDAGRLLPLRTGATIGRNPHVGIPLADLQASREHARLQVDHGRVRVYDLGTTNGTTVDDVEVGQLESVELTVGQRLRVGASVLRLVTPTQERPGAVREGRRTLHRPPRTVPILATANLERPAGLSFERTTTPWLMALLPLPIAAVLALVLRSPTMLALALAGPVMLLAQSAHDRRRGRTGRARQRADLHERIVRLEQSVAELTTRELADRRRLAPDLAEVLSMAISGRAWPREPHDADYLLLRLGTGTVPSGVQITEPDRTLTRPRLDHAPIAVSVNEHRVLGISGTEAARAALLRSLVGQLVALHSPAALRLVLVTSRPTDLTWTQWLPHVRPAPAAAPALVHPHDVEALRDLIGELITPPAEHRHEAAAAVASPSEVTVHTVLVLDGAGLADLPVICEALRHGAAHGLAVVAATTAHADLPGACTATVDLPSAHHGVLGTDQPQSFVPDLPCLGWHLHIATAIAGLVDATPATHAGRLPDHVRFWDVVGEDPSAVVTPTRVAQQWHHQPRSTTVPLGRDAEGPVVLDLAADGPHALVAGTTGAGKSELLQTLIAALALGNRPDELCFLLVDYKGGSAFSECARLPHTVGLVTDLDPHLTRRALASLEAEVRRRERILRAADAVDLVSYQRCSRPDLPTLPRLVLVIDEFRVLAQELPEFIDGLVRIAAVGRSLGIHVVLATQRPAGVVSAEIRANLSLRIALRVRDAADSQDVIDSPQAARISARTPGRAVVRTGATATRWVQVARVGGPATAAGASTVRVRAVDPVHGTVESLPAASPGTGSTDLALLVEAVNQASTDLAVPTPSSPWLPPLPAQLVLDALGRVELLIGADEDDRYLESATDVAANTDTAALEASTSSSSRGPVAALGLLDLPQQQRRSVLGWSLSSGHLAVSGGPRSGRSTLARSVVSDLARRYRADDLHLYLLDPAGSLAGLERLPHCGARVDSGDPARLAQVVDWLGTQVRQRQEQLSRTQHSDLAELRSDDDADSPAHLLVVIDGWDSLTEDHGSLASGAVLDTLMQVLREGASAGIHVLLTGGRAVLSGRVGAHVPHRMCLRAADELDLVLAGLRPAQVPEQMPPGRALVLPHGAELQVPLLSADAAGAAQAAVVQKLAESAPAAARCRPRRFADLPQRLELADLPGPQEGIALGLGGPEAALVCLPHEPALGRSLLVAGAPRSGRTTTLLTLGAQFAAEGGVHWLAGSSRLPELPSGVLPAQEDPDQLWKVLDAAPNSILIVDDYDLLTGPTWPELVDSYLELCSLGRGTLLLSGSTDELSAAHRGAAAHLRRRRTGLLLRPGRRDGDLLGVVVAASGRDCPGRGVLVDRGHSIDVQVAIAE